jgi:hypothetical protein
LSTLKNVVTEFVDGFLKGCTTSIDKLVTVSYRAGIYGKMSKGNFVPLGLQPDSSTIVVAYRKYSISTRNSSYKKQ